MVEFYQYDKWCIFCVSFGPRLQTELLQQTSTEYGHVYWMLPSTLVNLKGKSCCICASSVISLDFEGDNHLRL